MHLKPSKQVWPVVFRNFRRPSPNTTHTQCGQPTNFVSTVDTGRDLCDTQYMAERKTMNVSMSPEHKSFIKAQVSTGRFRNDSEVVRAGLRLLEEQARHRKLEELLLDGLNSGRAVETDKGYWSDLRNRVSNRAAQGDRDSA